MVASLERTLQPEGAGASMLPARRAQLHYGFGQLHLYYGRMDEAVAQSLHTAVIDRQGTLVANIEGNRFTATHLVDLVDTILRR